MYQVIQQGKVVERFHMFVDAWLFVVLVLPCFARIHGPDGIWTVNPTRTEIN
jgi:hypothetical protein